MRTPSVHIRASAPIIAIWLLFVAVGAGLPVAAQQELPEPPPGDPAALVDSVLTDPLMSPRDRVLILEGLLQKYEAPEVDWAYRAADALGRIYLAMGQDRLAIPYLEFAVTGRPSDADLKNTLGYLYATENLKLERAVDLVRDALELAPDSTSEQTIGYYRDSLGWAYFKQGELDSALVHLEAADVMAPGTPEIREHLVDAYSAADRIDAASDILVEDLVASRGFDRRLRSRLRRLHRTTPRGRPIEPELEAERRVRAVEAGEIAEVEAAGGQVVRIEANDGYGVVGTYLPPAHDDASEEPVAGVILIHMLGSERGQYMQLAQRFRDQGVAALSIDVRGHGASLSEDIPGIEAFRDDFAGNFEGAIRDVAAAIQFMQQRDGIDPERIGVVAASMGGLWAIFGSEVVERPVSALVLLSPGFTEEVDDVLRRAPERPVLMVASADDLQSTAAAEQLYERLDPSRSRVMTISGAGHGTDMLGEIVELEPFVVLWLQGALAD